MVHNSAIKKEIRTETIISEEQFSLKYLLESDYHSWRIIRLDGQSLSCRVKVKI